MSKSNRKRQKHKQNNSIPKYEISNFVTFLGIAAIILYAIFLRVEDFSTWQKKKADFQFQGEYQMANFDSYYYLKAAKDLQNGTYDKVDERRHVPDGAERPTIPPLLSILAFGISEISGLALASVAIFIPPLLSSLLALMVFVLSRQLSLSRIASLTAAFFSIISLTYVARTRVGVFDTDSLNVVFPLVNSYLFYAFIKSKDRKGYTYLGLAIFNTFLFWIWWNTAGSIVLISFLIPFLVVGLLFFPTSNTKLKYGILALTVIASLFLLSEQISTIFELLLGVKTSPFPNNVEISELDPVTPVSFLMKSLPNPLLILLVLGGSAYFIARLKLKALIFAFPILLAFLPFVGGNRFIIFSAPIMAIAIGYAVEFFYEYKGFSHPAIAPVAASLIMIVGFSSTYAPITDNYKPTAAQENVDLLNAIKDHTPSSSDIWTDADLGYQIQYYLDRGTFGDGGEPSYYLYYPLAADNLALTANFMKFYHQYGSEGMQSLYALFPSVNDTFLFLTQTLSLPPNDTRDWLEAQQENGMLPASQELSTIDQWLSFLYPKPKKELYFFTYYKMTQTAAWFKQGNSDLITGETKGLPLFLTFDNLSEENGIIGNNQIKIDTSTGFADYFDGTRHSFQYLLTYDGGEPKMLLYTPDGKLLPSIEQDIHADDRFAFQWNKNLGFGAALSKEMGDTAFVQLFLQNSKTDYFEPVVLNSPFYQIWRVRGDVYEE